MYYAQNRMLILGTCSDGPYFLDGTILKSPSTLPVHVTFGLFTVHLYTFLSRPTCHAL